MSVNYDESRTLGQAMFENAKLGDRRRNARLIRTFDAIRRHPDGTLPNKLASPADLKALYRLVDCDEVTHEALINSIRDYTLKECAAEPDRVVLLIHDDTELDYSSCTTLKGELGQIGPGFGHGFICHNVLAVDAESGGVIGLADQILHRRVRVPKNESYKERRKRESRESRLWVAGTKHMPAERRYVDVADQGADCFEFIEHEARSGRTFVIRAHHMRKVRQGHDESQPIQYLPKIAQLLAEVGAFTMDIRPQKGRKARKNAHLIVRAGAVMVYPPHFRVGNHGRDPFPLYLISVTETKPPKGEKPIVWQLLTNEPIKNYDDASRVIEWYEKRWVIEEFHKAQKTGCKIESLQFTTASRLKPAIALLSAVATTLLKLRDASRRPDAKKLPARAIIAPEHVKALTMWRYGEVRMDVSVHDFFFALARLGGHQNRRHDHRPGWITLWRGWMKLNAMPHASPTIKRKCG